MMGPIQLFATSPQSLGADRVSYLQDVVRVARWSEAAGCTGILVYTDNGIVDPWLVAQVIISNTAALCPLVAVQPVYMHPYTAAKMITSLAFLHGRRVFLNLVAGGFTNDLLALDDHTPHDRRYQRLIEYGQVITALLKGGPVNMAGEFYKVDKLALKPPLPPELFPGILVSGSSEAGRQAARELGAVAVCYPGPAAGYDPGAAAGGGIRVGIIAREDGEAAWEVAYRRFPADRKGQLTHQLAMKVSDSAWHKQLSAMAEASGAEPDAYWLVPFQNSKTNCPYLVGSYTRVAAELARYTSAGFNTFILDIPPTEEELHHIGVVFDRAARTTTAGMGS